MGFKCSPYFAQQVPDDVLCNGDDTEVYLDNIGAISPTWEHHLILHDKILCDLVFTSIQL